MAALACECMVADMEAGNEPYWLTLQGVNGCGKTYLLGQVYEQAKRINPGNPLNNPIWPPDWETSQRKVYEGGRPATHRMEEQVFSSYLRTGRYNFVNELRDDFFLAFDEVGATRDPTNFIAEGVGTLCDNRLGKWTMFCTNLTLGEIAERMDARISSRMLRNENKFIAITAGDYALKG